MIVRVPDTGLMHMHLTLTGFNTIVCVPDTGLMHNWYRGGRASRWHGGCSTGCGVLYYCTVCLCISLLVWVWVWVYVQHWCGVLGVGYWVPACLTACGCACVHVCMRMCVNMRAGVHWALKDVPVCECLCIYDMCVYAYVICHMCLCACAYVICVCACVHVYAYVISVCVCAPLCLQVGAPIIYSQMFGIPARLAFFLMPIIARIWRMRRRSACLTQDSLDRAYQGHEFELAERWGGAGLRGDGEGRGHDSLDRAYQ